MEQHHTQEHIAALCAASTLGVAATGFVLASEDSTSFPMLDETQPPRATFATSDGPRRTVPNPGSSSQRSVASPAVASSTPDYLSPTLLHRTRRIREVRPGTATESEQSDSRGSSLNRGDGVRPRTADTRSTSERRDPSTGSSWLKRLSMVSSSTASSPAVSIRQKNEATIADVARPMTSYSKAPNKLVKRSPSQRDSSGGSIGSLLRRPATSHQRSATMQAGQPSSITNINAAADLNEFVNSTSDNELIRPSWRPFFERGYLKKRHSLGNTYEAGLFSSTPISARGRPTLISGASIEKINSGETEISLRDRESGIPGIFSTRRHRLRRSLSSIPRISRRQYFTDPETGNSNGLANFVQSSPANRSPISPISNISAFDVDLPTQSPVLNSSPPITAVRHRFSFRKRDSTVPSDPTTLSSDNDTRVFTDDDSLEFQSDTAYDSLTTRGTAHSQATSRIQKLDSLFAEEVIANGTDSTSTVERLLPHLSLRQPMQNSIESPELPHAHHPGATAAHRERDDGFGKRLNIIGSLTPVKTTAINDSKWASTPNQDQHPVADAESMSDDADTIDWSPKSDSTNIPKGPNANANANAFGYQSGQGFTLQSQQAVAPTGVSPSVSNRKRLSIFDWSENQRGSETTRHTESRPKTVHGKQVHDSVRSRSSGRKPPNQLHLRSQSVPSNRDAQAEPTYSTAAKFGTWGLGHKPVSEEWSDDFEFDDVDEEVENPPDHQEPVLEPDTRGSVRGVRVPQSIIDRQASVHTQFGQVQEFMMLVEELKRLRARGITLDLLESRSKNLWEDAESIINLATINDDDEDDGLHHLRQKSPLTSDSFGDDVYFTGRADDTLSHQSRETPQPPAAQRPTPTPGTPPSVGRPRGESLAQAKTFLQTIHQNRGADASPVDPSDQPLRKLPFDTQDLKDLVVRSGVITRALKEIVRIAEGVSVSPQKLPKPKDPAFSQIFRGPETSPCPPSRRSGLPKSNSTHGYLNGATDNNTGDVASSRPITATV